MRLETDRRRSHNGTMSVEAVVTTGIYCRPGCPGRPHPENTRRYGSAAEAEANGFRACLRCRPYRDESSVDLVSTPELVCRGVRMILDGALDGANEAELAARVGASPRNLRRLFVEHVGVTPDQLARSRRAHFARRLLDDTDLSVTEIAFASGFGERPPVQPDHGRDVPGDATRAAGSPPRPRPARGRRRAHGPPAVHRVLRLGRDRRVPRGARDPGRGARRGVVSTAGRSTSTAIRASSRSSRVAPTICCCGRTCRTGRV